MCPGQEQNVKGSGVPKNAGKKRMCPGLKLNVKGPSAPKNHGKGPVRPEQSPREKNFRYLKAGILPSMASATEVLNARQANAGSKAAGVKK